jgi:hypothetical protein
VAVPSSPSICSRALYYPYATPAPVRTVNPLAPNQVDFVGSGVPPDCGPAGVALPAFVLSLGGASPDYAGMVLAVHTLSGAIVLRSAGFSSGQPMLNLATWTTNGSNPLQARWALVDALS